MTADLAARLAEIKDRHIPGDALTLAQLINEAKTTHPHASGEVIVRGCVVSDAARLREAVRQVWLKDLPALVSAVNAVLNAEPPFETIWEAEKLYPDGWPEGIWDDEQMLNWRDGFKAGLDVVREAVASALADIAEEASRA